MPVMLNLDHLVVSASRLEDGVAYVEDLLGVKMQPGGKHPLMSTHNQLLSIGDSFIEVIAVDPVAPDPGRPRWFDLDNFSGAPRLTTWVANTSDLSKALAVAPAGSGVSTRASRGDLTWDFAIPENGKQPFDGAFPGLMSWGATPHPTTRMPEAGCRLVGFEISLPDQAGLVAAMEPFGAINGVSIVPGEAGFRAEIETPSGRRILE